MKSFVRSMIFLGGLVLFLELCVIIANHRAEETSSSKQKKEASTAFLTGGTFSGNYQNFYATSVPS